MLSIENNSLKKYQRATKINVADTNHPEYHETFFDATYVI
jgi:hypothetical protein